MSLLLSWFEHIDIRTRVWQEKIWPALLASVLGTLLVYGAGFATTAAMHNAAHDGRHAASFPCH